MDFKQVLESQFLPFVIKPGRYIGNELGSIHKAGDYPLRMALAFADKYELGMSNLGLQIIYKLVNDLDFAVCERVFAPDLDAEKRLRDSELPLFSLESFTPLNKFDLVGFSLSYELCLTNVLTILDLSRIPLKSTDRGDSDPLICAGGPICFNAEPISDFIDFFYVGEVETVLEDILRAVTESKTQSRHERLRRLAVIPGVYVPSFYRPSYNENGHFAGFEKVEPSAPDRIVAGVNRDISSRNYPDKPLVPFEEVTHDRLAVEIMRGCGHGCRFCQAGVIYRPKRDRKVDDIVQQVVTAIDNSGYEELTLLSLSSSDYRELDLLLARLHDRLRDKHVKISLPSLRPTQRSLELARKVSPEDKPALTFALEGGTERMRSVINKQVSIEEFYQVIQNALASGWRLIKLYFMIGLPTETEADIDGIVDVIKNCERICRRQKGKASINVTISPFSPKAHTPWQWEPHLSIEEIVDKNAVLRRACRGRYVQLKTRSAETSYLEGVFSRGDRRLGNVILRAYELGARFDGWSEHFDFSIWKRAFDDSDLSMDEYCRERELVEPLPWDHVDKGVSKDWLWREYQRAHEVGEVRVPNGQGFKLADLAIPAAEVAEELLVPKAVTAARFGRKPKRTVSSTVMAVPRSRIRVSWAKDESVRFMAHLANTRVFERAIRRAGIPVSFTQGFRPRQKLSFGPPLTLGYVSKMEYLDIQLESPYSDEMFDRLRSNLPSGFTALEARTVLAKGASLSSLINLACYEVPLPKDHGITQAVLDDTLSLDSLVITRRRADETKEVEVRKSILTLELRTEKGSDLLYMELGLGNLGFVRPDELLINRFGLSQESVLPIPICRTDLLIWQSGQRLTPFEVN
jgi:radical SAM family uncharacterized protein/radical SAM-linked protein